MDQPMPLGALTFIIRQRAIDLVPFLGPQDPSTPARHLGWQSEQEDTHTHTHTSTAGQSSPVQAHRNFQYFSPFR